MNPLKNVTKEQVEEAIKQVSGFECPTPRLNSFYKHCIESETYGELANGLFDFLCSGVYLLGVLLKEQSEGGNYECTTEELEQFKIEGSDAYIIHGNLILNGDLLVENTFLVTGNLVVNGVVSDYGCGSFISVLGELHANAMRTTGWVIIGRDCTVKGYFYGHYNDDAFECLGTLRAKAVVTEEHSISATRIAPELLPVGDKVWGDQIFNIRDEKDRDFLRALFNEEMELVIYHDDFAAFGDDE